MPISTALQILEEEAGKQFDPQLVSVFSDMVKREQKDELYMDRLKVVKSY
jgi:HD-GYP domain-containing protein (c-di-GMP phosphodiesterase class II)